jgi:hypothetical protein
VNAVASIRGLVTGELVCPDESAEPLDVEWAWDSRDPLVVALGFLAARVTWTIDRQLLAEGLRRKAGSGDVIVGPDGGSVLLHLKGCGGRALLRFNAAEVKRFVSATYDAADDTAAASVVRAGVDTLLRGLFGPGAAGGQW